MIIRKEENKTFYKYLQLIYNVLGDSSSGDAMFIENGKMYFATYPIGGILSIKLNDVELYDELLKEPGTYEIRLSPHNSFEIKRIADTKVTEEMKNVYKHAMIGIRNNRPLCEINAFNSSIIANIARLSKLRVRDAYIKYFKKLKVFDVGVNDDFIICTKYEDLEKDRMHVRLDMYFWCEDIKEEFEEFN